MQHGVDETGQVVRQGLTRRRKPDATLAIATVLDPSQREENFGQLDERTDWFYEAINASYAKITKPAGVGFIYVSTYRDKDGDWPIAQSHIICTSAQSAREQFWSVSVSVYDIDTRDLFRNHTLKAEVLSTRRDSKRMRTALSMCLSDQQHRLARKQPGSDRADSGSPIFRLYAATQPYFDRSRPLPDTEKTH